MNNEEYNIIRGHDKAFQLVPTYNSNIHDVCKVATEASVLTHKERIYYAEIGEIEFSEEDKNGNPVFEFEQKYTSKGIYHVALAEALFLEFPKVLKFKKGKAIITDRKTYDKINRGEVYKAFEDFLGKFGENRYEVKGFLHLLASDPSLKNMLLNPLVQEAQVTTPLDTSETSEDGVENSSKETDTGKEHS